MRAAAVVGVVAGCLAGCVTSNTVPCGDALCPPGFTCIDEVCIAPGDACGNHHTDLPLDEVCDDGNQLDGDGCSADCRSNETCGNGRVDALASVPEACECDGADCTVADEVCIAYGADFGLLTCGAAGTADACQLAFSACETFGFRQRASADAARIRIHGGDVIALDRLGQISIFTDETPDPIPAIGPGIGVNDFVLVGDTVYAAGDDSNIYRTTLGAAGWEPAVYTATNNISRLELQVVDASTVDLIVQSTRGAVQVVRGSATGFAVRGPELAGATTGSDAAVYMTTDGTDLARYTPTGANPWQPVAMVLPPAEKLVDAAQYDGVDWITTTLTRVLALDPGSGAPVGGRPPFFQAGSELQFVPGASVTVAADSRIAEWNGTAWHLIEPALFAPIRTSAAAGDLRVIADVRGLQIEQPRSYQTASSGQLAMLDAVIGPAGIYFTIGSTIHTYDGTAVVAHDSGTLTTAIPPPEMLVPQVRSWCGFDDDTYVAASDDNVVTCTPAGCGALEPVATGTTSVVHVRCTIGPHWAWVVSADASARVRVHRYDAPSHTLVPAPVLVGADAVDALVTITTTAMPASSTTIAVGRDGGAGAVWTITGTNNVEVVAHPEFAQLFAVESCGGGEWIAGGLSATGHAAILRHRIGGEDVIELPRAQPVVAISGTCETFYVATRTDLLYIDAGVITPLRWPFLEALVAIQAIDQGTADPRDDTLYIASRSAVRALR